MPSALANGALKSAMLEKLKESALGADDARVLGFSTVTAAECKALGLPAYGGFKIPYFDLEGKRTDFYRVRYLEETRDGFLKHTDAKQLRYIQLGKTVNEVYLPPFTDWRQVAADITIPLIITEGELKAACATKLQLPTVGLGGVWCWMSKAQKLRILPMLARITWAGRPVYLAYDSDAVTNQMVKMAELALCDELLRMQAMPHIVRLPALSEDAKTGLDDFLVARGTDELMKLLKHAEPYVGAKELHKLNAEIAYVRDPGLILRLDTMQKMTVSSFKEHAFATRTFKKEVVTQNNSKFVEVSAPAEWVKWPGRYEVSRITYAPGRPQALPDGSFNSWKGWGCEPTQGSVKPWLDLLGHLFGEDTKALRWLERWLAYPLQHPGVKLYTAALVWGIHHGTGKSLIGYTMKEIYGTNWAEVDTEQLNSSFNEWAENRQFVMGDEITSSGNDKRNSADRMKSRITQQELRLNVKWLPSYTVPDCINWYFTSNHPDALFLEDYDRRYFIHQVLCKPRDMKFYADYVRWLQSGGAQHIFYYMLNLDLEGFEPNAPAPLTAAKQEMIEDGRTALGVWVAAVLRSPDSMLKLGDGPLSGDLWTAKELLGLFDPSGMGKHSEIAVGRELKRQGASQPYRGLPINTRHGPVRLYALRNAVRWEAAGRDKIIEHYEATRGVLATPAAPKKRKEKF